MLLAAVIRTTMYGGTGNDGVRVSSFLVSGRLVIMGLLCTVYTLTGITWYVVYRVVLACIGSDFIDVTSVRRFGDNRFTECQPIRHIHVKKFKVWVNVHPVG